MLYGPRNLLAPSKPNSVKGSLAFHLAIGPYTDKINLQRKPEHMNRQYIKQ